MSEPDPTLDNGTPTWHFRAFTPADIPAVTALFDAADRADNLYKLSSEDDIRETFADTDRASPGHLFLVEAPVSPASGPPLLLGLGRVLPTFHAPTRERIYNVMLRTHPSARNQGLHHVIARSLIAEARAHESHPATEPAGKVRVRTYIFNTQQSSIEAWESVGLRKEREGWTMARALDPTIMAPQPPPGITLRNYSHPGDNSHALEVLNNSFADYYDFYPLTSGSWERQMADPYARLDLSWLAFSQQSGKAVGLAVCWVNDSQNLQSGRLEGWIEGIGVIPTFRNQGIGKAMLGRCLRSLRDASLNIALADVDAGAPAALNLFHSTGFNPRSVLLQYECPLEQTVI